MVDKKQPTIREKYNPGRDEFLKLRHVYQRFWDTRDSSARLEASKDWDKWDKQWEAYRTVKDPDDWTSNHVVPLTPSIIESELAEVIDQNWRPMIVARGEEDKAKVAVARRAYEYSWEIANGDLAVLSVLKDALIRGTGIGQEYVWSEKRKVKFLKARQGKEGPEVYEKEEEVTDFDNPYLESVKLEDFFPDEKGRYFGVGPYSCRDAIRRYIMDINVFKEVFSGPVWDPMGNVKYVTPGGDTNYWEFYKPPDSLRKDKDVEVLWYWGKRPWDALIIVANDVVVRMGPNPYNHKQLPFGRAVDIYKTHQFWGKGECALMESIQDELNTIRRQRLDRSHLNIDPMILTSNREDLDENQLIARPHGSIQVDDVNNFKQLFVTDTPQSAYQEEDRLKDDAVRITGMDPRMQGLTQAGAGTATEAAILKEQTLKRLRAKIWLLDKTFLTEVGRLRMANILQFYSQPKMERIIGEAGMQSYERAISEAKEKGIYKEVDKVPYRVKYPKIRLKNHQLDVGEDGKITESQAKGETFFEIKPEYLLPENGSYDIIFTSSPNLSISKPLEQQRLETVLQHPLVVAGIEQGIYDLAKVGDALFKVHDLDPEEMRAPSGATAEMVNPQQLIDLANEENQRMMSGEKIGPTPMATGEHTQMHIQFMRSPEFMQIPLESDINTLFLNHVVGEVMAIQRRGANPLPSATSQPGAMMPGTQPGQPPAKGEPPKNMMGAVMPNMIQGGGQVQGAGLPNPTQGGGAPVGIFDKFKKLIGRK